MTFNCVTKIIKWFVISPNEQGIATTSAIWTVCRTIQCINDAISWEINENRFRIFSIGFQQSFHFLRIRIHCSYLIGLSYIMRPPVNSNFIFSAQKVALSNVNTTEHASKEFTKTDSSISITKSFAYRIPPHVTTGTKASMLPS